MNGKPEAPFSWTLLRGSITLRSACSLGGLNRQRGCEESTAFDEFIRCLHATDPMDGPREHPDSDLTSCSQAARELADRICGFSPDDVTVVMRVYDSALVDASDGKDCMIDILSVGRFSRNEITNLTFIARRHAEAINHWWASYAATVKALFGSSRR